MKSINEMPTNLKKSDLDHDLLKDYVAALKNPDFKALVAHIQCPEEIAMKYTSQLERTARELKNCSKCPSLMECANDIEGCVYYPTKEDDRLRFNYVACKYKQRQIRDEKYKSLVFEEPFAIKNARMADIDLTDKKRAKFIKAVNNFYKNYANDHHIKGLFVHGSFGSGKTYILAALLNELAKNGVKTVIIYYPEMLRILKESFQDDFDDKMRLLKMTDILLIDDIQFLGSANATQQEFTNTFNSLRENKKQIIISSDRSVDDLKMFADRLKTRFNWGLKAIIGVPEFELKVKIIKNKIKSGDLMMELSDEIINFIASSCGSDVRNLEGAITRLYAYSAIWGI